MSFIVVKELEERRPVAGFRAWFVHCDSMTVAHWEVEAGATMPDHSHPHEQVFNLIRGEFDLTVGGETKRMTPGTAAVIGPDVPHSGTAVTPCQIIDVFHPARDDYR